jgi:hypothetical protein
MKTTPVLLLFLVSARLSGGEFVNLRFDEPDLSGPLVPQFENGPLEGTMARLLRGWTALENGVPVEKAGYSPAGRFGFVNPVGLYDNAFDFRKEDFGAYGISLSSSSLAIPPPQLQLKQTGKVPADAATLELFNGGYVRVLVNGELIGESNVSYPIFDVSKFAGQTVDLEFDFGRGQQTSLDIFGFKPIPEPSTWALLGVGAAAVFCIGRRKI